MSTNVKIPLQKLVRFLGEIKQRLAEMHQLLENYRIIVLDLRKEIKRLLKEIRNEKVKLTAKQLEKSLGSKTQSIERLRSKYKEWIRRLRTIQTIRVQDISETKVLRAQVEKLQRDVERGLEELKAVITEIDAIKEEVEKLSGLYWQPGGGAGRECTVRVLVLDEKSGKGVEEIEVSIGDRVCKTNSEGVAEEKVGCNKKVKVKIEDQGKPCIVKRWEINGKVIRREDNGEDNELDIDVTEDIELKAYVEASNS